MITFQDNIMLNSQGACQYFNYKGHYFEFRITDRSTRINITDLTEAGKPGKTCRELYIWDKDLFYKDLRSMPVHDFAVKNLHTMFDMLITNNKIAFTQATSDYFAENETELYIKVSEEKAIKYAPLFPETVYKPLKDTPKKWTKTHILRLIANKQYEAIECPTYYTDEGTWKHGGYFLDLENAFPKIFDFLKNYTSGSYIDNGKLKLYNSYKRYIITFKNGVLND